MKLADCYRLLGLRVGASHGDVKAAYRQLARRYHPDANPGDQQASDKFIQVTEAYKTLMAIAPLEGQCRQSTAAASSPTSYKASSPSVQTQTGQQGFTSRPKVRVTRHNNRVEYLPDLSQADLLLKQQSYVQLQDFLKTRRFPRAIAMVEGLAQRLPQDPEVRQWQAIAYQQWGRHLIRSKDYDKARVYLKKALKTDPHNRSLWLEVDRDFRKLEQVY
jgi:curved DNA-binding protein CbpA